LFHCHYRLFLLLVLPLILQRLPKWQMPS
jgi:hypothetical protein